MTNRKRMAAAVLILIGAIIGGTLAVAGLSWTPTAEAQVRQPVPTEGRAARVIVDGTVVCGATATQLPSNEGPLRCHLQNPSADIRVYVGSATVGTASNFIDPGGSLNDEWLSNTDLLYCRVPVGTQKIPFYCTR